MSCNYITFRNGAKVARPIGSREEYLAIRNSNRNVRNLKAARKGDEKAKKHLVQMNYSGYYPNGTIKGSRYVSRAFGFDIDSAEEFERVVPMLLAEPEKYGLLMMERSARNGGHLVVKRDVERTILENQVMLATALDTEVDTNAHDRNRVFFTSTASSSELLYLSDELFADTYDEQAANDMLQRLENRTEDLPEGAHCGNKHFKPKAAAIASATNEGSQRGQEVPQSASANAEAGAQASQACSGVAVQEDSIAYEGIPYKRIIDKYWELFNNGKEPVKSNRDMKTYELSYYLRHVCGFDREVMDRVIPNYDGFPQEQKMKCIDSALSDRRTHMPRRLKEVLEAVRQDLLEENRSIASIDDLEHEDNRRFFDALPSQLPKSIRYSIDAVGPTLAFPAIVSVAPVIGALATGVQLSVHGRYNTLNLISYTAGDAASGKGSLDPLVEAWMHNLMVQDAIYFAQEEDYRQRKKAAKNKKEQPEEPQLPIRCLTLNNTVANIADRLGKTQDKHAISFTPEADSLAQQWKNSMSNYSILLRIAYDAAAFHREAKSLDAVNVHIPNLRWNVVMAGTPDALYRVVSNYTDGFQSRIALARTPDNTYQPLSETFYQLKDFQMEHIYHVAELLTMMNGKAELPKLEAEGQKWLEMVRLASMKNDDKVMARQRFRVCVTAQRIVCCLMLASVCDTMLKNSSFALCQKNLREHPTMWEDMLEKAQTPAMLSLMPLIADTLLDNNLYFFRDRIEAALTSKDYCGNKRINAGRNDSIYERLDATFTLDQALQTSAMVKGSQATRNTVQQMLKNWKKQGLIYSETRGIYKKLYEG